MGGMTSGFSLDGYHRVKKTFVCPAYRVNTYGSATTQQEEVSHPELYVQLKKLRDSLCARTGMPIYLVAGSNTLFELCRYLPQTPGELRHITGFGPAKVEKYGAGFLAIITSYSEARGLGSLIDEKMKKKTRKPVGRSAGTPSNTREESFRLFREGKTIGEIAGERKLTVQTIEGHLADYVLNGTIDVGQLLSREKMQIIEPALEQMAGSSITAIKARLGSGISFGELRIALAWKQFQDSRAQVT
jgi:hypothetical protein